MMEHSPSAWKHD
jgi:clathrin heavy chain